MSCRHDFEVFQSSVTSWSSKIIDDGIVESSHRTCGSVQHLLVEPGVLLVVLDLLARLDRDVPTLTDPRPDAVGGLVGVDLVAEHEHLVRPAGRRAAGPSAAHTCPARRVVVAVALDRVRGRVAARPEDDAEGRVRVHRADPRCGQVGVGRRPDDLAVQRDVVRRAGAPGQPVDDDQGVVVPGHLPGALGATEHPDGARRVGLHPHGGVGLADVPQQRAQDEPGHGQRRGAGMQSLTS